MTTDLTTGVRLRDRVAVVDLRGDVNSTAEDPVRSAWDEVIRSRPTAVVLNFEDAGYINSTGLAVIVGLLTRARSQGIPIRAYGLSPHYREIFEITRLADYIAIHPDENSAVRGLERSTT